MESEDGAQNVNSTIHVPAEKIKIKCLIWIQMFKLWCNTSFTNTDFVQWISTKAMLVNDTLFTVSEWYVLITKTYLYKYGTAMQLYFTVKLYWLVQYTATYKNCYCWLWIGTSIIKDVSLVVEFPAWRNILSCGELTALSNTFVSITTIRKKDFFWEAC